MNKFKVTMFVKTNDIKKLELECLPAVYNKSFLIKPLHNNISIKTAYIADIEEL